MLPVVCVIGWLMAFLFMALWLFVLLRDACDAETDEDERTRLLRDLDNNWLHYTGDRGVPEDAWAIEKCIALLRGRKSRWW